MADPAAFDDYVAARGTALARTAYLLTGDRHDAEDLVQSALFRAAQAWHRIEGDPDPYVRRILYRENVSAWRRRRHVTEVALGSLDRPGTADDPDLRLALRAALARLTPRQRAVLVLRFFEDLSVAHTADVLGIAVGTVKSATRDALARLRVVAPDLAGLVPHTVEEAVR